MRNLKFGVLLIQWATGMNDSDGFGYNYNGSIVETKEPKDGFVLDDLFGFWKSNTSGITYFIDSDEKIAMYSEHGQKLNYSIQMKTENANNSNPAKRQIDLSNNDAKIDEGYVSGSNTIQWKSTQKWIRQKTFTTKQMNDVSNEFKLKHAKGVWIVTRPVEEGDNVNPDSQLQKQISEFGKKLGYLLHWSVVINGEAYSLNADDDGQIKIQTLHHVSDYTQWYFCEIESNVQKDSSAISNWISALEKRKLKYDPLELHCHNISSKLAQFATTEKCNIEAGNLKNFRVEGIDFIQDFYQEQFRKLNKSSDPMKSVLAKMMLGLNALTVLQKNTKQEVHAFIDQKRENQKRKNQKRKRKVSKNRF